MGIDEHTPLIYSDYIHLLHIRDTFLQQSFLHLIDHSIILCYLLQLQYDRTSASDNDRIRWPGRKR